MVKLCWLCERLAADRGGACYACRRAIWNDTPTPWLRRDAARLTGVLAAVLIVSAAVLTPAVVSPPTLPWRTLPVQRHLAARPIAYVTTMVVEQVKRKVFPYSIVPGGAADVLQAKWAMADPAVKANYTNVDFSHLRQETLKTNLKGYVSYRWGEKIYWTKKALTLRAGETIFTDGVHIVRGRCLNCYSALPMNPTRPTEPTEKVLDVPAEMPVIVYSFPKLPVLAPELPIPPGELTPVVPAIIPVVTTIGKSGGGFWFPILPIIPPIHRHPSSPTSPGSPSGPGSPGGPGGGSGPGTPPVPPVAIVPEPRYGWFLAVGLLAIALARGLRLRMPV